MKRAASRNFDPRSYHRKIALFGVIIDDAEA